LLVRNEITITRASLLGVHKVNFSYLKSRVAIASMNLSPGAVPPLEDTSEDHSDDGESPDDSSTNFKDSDKGEHNDTQQQDDIAGQDSVGVSRWRRMVVLMLLLTAALVITSTYLFLSREETNEFEKSVSFSMLVMQQAMLRGGTTKTR
jgi:hypothetical protein